MVPCRAGRTATAAGRPNFRQESPTFRQETLPKQLDGQHSGRVTEISGRTGNTVSLFYLTAK